MNFLETRPKPAGPRLDRPARVQFGQIHFGVFSETRFAPLSLSSDRGSQLTGISKNVMDTFSSFMVGPN